MGFAGSLCDGVSSTEDFRAIFYTDSPIPYCRCEHIHFVDVDQVIDFLRVDLASIDNYGLPKTDNYLFDNYSFLFNALFKSWPTNKILKKHLYDSALASIKNLAEEFNTTIILIDHLYENGTDTDVLNCCFPETRYKLSEGTFHLLEEKEDMLNLQYLDHQTLESIPFKLKSKAKEITQVYPAYTEE